MLILTLLFALTVALPAHADPGYTLRVPDQVELAPGAAGAVSLTIAPEPGKTISSAGPIRIDVAPPDGVTVPKRRLGRRDAVDPAAESPRFELKLKRAPGLAPAELPLSFDVRFWLCGKKVCRPVREKAIVKLAATLPETTPAAPR